MAEDIKKTVIIKVDLDIAGYKKELQYANGRIADLQKSQKELVKSGKQSSSQFADNQIELKKYNTQVSDLKRVINNATVANGEMTGSNVQLKAALSASTYELNKLSEAEVEGTSRGQLLKQQVLNLTDSLKKNESAVGDNRRNVGNYGEALKELKDDLKNAKGEALNAAKAFGTDSKEFQEATKRAGDLQDQMNDVNEASKAMATGSDFGKFSNQLKLVGNDLLELDFQGAAEKAKGLSSTVKNFSFKGMVDGAKALTTTLIETGKAMLSIPIVAIAAAIAAIVGAIVLWRNTTAENAQNQIEWIERINKKYQDLYDRQIKLAAAAGKEVANLEMKKLINIRDSSEKEIAILEKKYKKVAGLSKLFGQSGLNDEEKKQLDDLKVIHANSINDITALKIEGYTKQSKDSKKSIEDSKKSIEKYNDDLKKIEEKRQQDLKDIETANSELNKKIQDEKIELIKDEETRLLAKAALDNTREIQGIVTSQANAKTKAEALEAQQLIYEQNIQKIKDDFAKKDLDAAQAEIDKQAELDDKAGKDKLAAIKKQSDASKSALDEELKDNLIAYDKKKSDLDIALASYLITNEEYQKKLKELEIDYAKQKKDEINKIEQEGFKATAEIVNGIFAIQKNNRDQEIIDIDNETKYKIDALQKQADQGIISQQEFQTKSNRINLDAQKRESELKKKQFESDKKAALINVAIKTAQAVMTAFATAAYPLNIIEAAFAVVTGGIQAAVINSQPTPAFAEGGLSGQKIGSNDGKRIYRPNGDNLLATVKAGEIITNENQQRIIENIAGNDIWSRAGVKGFASGGSTDGGALASRLSTGIDNTILLVNQQMRINRTLPAPVVYVESIIEATSNHAKVVSKGNL